MAIEKLLLSEITLDAGLQMRDGLNYGHVAQMEAVLIEGGSIDVPIIVFDDGTHKLLADGYHRWQAHKNAGRYKIMADIRVGSFDDARDFAEIANLTPGLGLSSKERRQVFINRVNRGFTYVLPDGDAVDFWALSNGALAAIFNVDAVTIKNWREYYMTTENSGVSLPSVVVSLDGSTTDTTRLRAGSEQSPVNDTQEIEAGEITKSPQFLEPEISVDDTPLAQPTGRFGMQPWQPPTRTEQRLHQPRPTSEERGQRLIRETGVDLTPVYADVIARQRYDRVWSAAFSYMEVSQDISEVGNLDKEMKDKLAELLQEAQRRISANMRVLSWISALEANQNIVRATIQMLRGCDLETGTYNIDPDDVDNVIVLLRNAGVQSPAEARS